MAAAAPKAPPRKLQSAVNLFKNADKVVCDFITDLLDQERGVKGALTRAYQLNPKLLLSCARFAHSSSNELRSKFLAGVLALKCVSPAEALREIFEVTHAKDWCPLMPESGLEHAVAAMLTANHVVVSVPATIRDATLEDYDGHDMALARFEVSMVALFQLDNERWREFVEESNKDEWSLLALLYFARTGRFRHMPFLLPIFPTDPHGANATEHEKTVIAMLKNVDVTEGRWAHHLVTPIFVFPPAEATLYLRRLLWYSDDEAPEEPMAISLAIAEAVKQRKVIRFLALNHECVGTLHTLRQTFANEPLENLVHDSDRELLTALVRSASNNPRVFKLDNVPAIEPYALAANPELIPEFVAPYCTDVLQEWFGIPVPSPLSFYDPFEASARRPKRSRLELQEGDLESLSSDDDLPLDDDDDDDDGESCPSSAASDEEEEEADEDEDEGDDDDEEEEDNKEDDE